MRKEDAMEVLKHGRFGCVMPHYRVLFIDREELFWCRREDLKKQHRGGTKGGLSLRNLLEVRLKKGAKIVALTFKERPLLIEALCDQDFDTLAAVFTHVMNDNMHDDRQHLVLSRGKR